MRSRSTDTPYLDQALNVLEAMQSWNILHYQYTWHTVPSVTEQHRRLRRSSQPSRQTLWFPWLLRSFRHKFHRWLVDLSHRYCDWYGITFNGQICDLPFGLVLKRSDGTRLEEVLAMRTARAAGLPVPRVISYAEHDDTPHAPASILMTRLPGRDLFKELWDWYTPEEKDRLKLQLKQFLDTIRAWRSPLGTKICSVAGTSIRSARVPDHKVGPCNDEDEFSQLLIEPSLGSWVKANFSGYDELSARAQHLIGMEHDVKFSHGDLVPHNLLFLDDGRISGFIDWEAAGWYPEYWEYTTGWGLSKSGNWWYDVVSELAEGRYDQEQDADAARWRVTIDSMFW